MTDLLRFGIIGCGSRLHLAMHNHSNNWQMLNSLLLLIRTESRARHFSEEYDAQAFVDYHDLLSHPDIDVVNICTPSGLHAQMGIEALEAGKHVHC